MAAQSSAVCGVHLRQDSEKGGRGEGGGWRVGEGEGGCRTIDLLYTVSHLLL